MLSKQEFCYIVNKIDEMITSGMEQVPIFIIQKLLEIVMHDEKWVTRDYVYAMVYKNGDFEIDGKKIDTAEKLWDYLVTTNHLFSDVMEDDGR